jgi:molybdopterin converting factor subunit 1
MRVRVLYFAKSREAAGTPEEEFELPSGATTTDLLGAMTAKHAGLASVMTACVLALNHDYLEKDEAVALKDGDEVAVIPPLSGG